MAVTHRKLAELQLIDQAQPRAKMDLTVVADYAELLAIEGKELPPIVVFGAIVADGFHRCLAYQRAGRKTIPTVTHQGSRRIAILYSCGANATHGLRRTNADKRRSVRKLLHDKEWGTWTSRRIANQCGVDHVFVENLRSGGTSGDGHHLSPLSEERKYVKHGQEHTQTVSLRPAPKPRPDNTVKRILTAILLLAKADVGNFDRGLTEPQRAKLHDNGDLRKARTFLDSL